MKYNEKKIIQEVMNYIESTYTQHYSVGRDGKIQVQDLLRQLGIDKDFCQANAIKYLARYGKKNGRNRKDLLKAMHYIILLMSSEDKDNGESEHETKQ
tara:strand:+ start:90 stop:383 length:294 start_codon:yes stop_codon:yes gene_type:complete